MDTHRQLLALAVLGLTGMLIASKPAAAATLVVDDDKVQCPHAAYTSIQDAVNDAAPGDTIKVCAGTYHEDVGINKTLILHGAGPAPKDRTGDPTKEAIVQPTVVGMDVTADDVVISGFTVEDVPSRPGIQTSELHSGYLIRGNRFNDNPNNGVGLRLNSSGAKKSIVEHNYFNGDSAAAETDGIFSNTGLHNVVIRDNTFFRNDSAGIVLTTLGGGTISDVTVLDNKSIEDGSLIALFTAPGTIITKNEVVRPQGSGIFIGQGNDGAVITNNKVSNGLARGIRVNALDFGGPSSTGLEISHNDIRNMAGSGIAIRSTSMTDSLISRNVSLNNGQDISGTFGRDGIQIDSGGNSGNTITRNKMEHNPEFDARDDTIGTGTAGTANTWTRNNCQTSSPSGLCD
jgi:hypothetical protein